MSLSRLVGSLFVLAAGGSLAMACSSAPVESTGHAGEAVTASPAACESMPTCSAIQYSWDDMDGPWFGASASGVAEAAKVKAEMIAIGCSAPLLYHACASGPDCIEGRPVPLSICPTGVSADVDALKAFRWCDACTGQPAAGQRLVTWAVPEEPGGCSGSLCEPLACEQAVCGTSNGPQCGMATVGCGNTVDCGSCPSGFTCDGNHCDRVVTCAQGKAGAACRCETAGGDFINGICQ